ncbi:hypothetical protein EDF84_10332 [Erwinia rhapontici]|nr:hypothetical protein EDF84_10332 [Erwinia rhapontici]
MGQGYLPPTKSVSLRRGEVCLALGQGYLPPTKSVSLRRGEACLALGQGCLTLRGGILFTQNLQTTFQFVVQGRFHTHDFPGIRVRETQRSGMQEQAFQTGPT